MKLKNVFTICRDGVPLDSSSLFSDALVWACVYSLHFPDSSISVLVSSRACMDETA
jgi:hypothetical protein